jgi:hypothetical protein
MDGFWKGVLDTLTALGTVGVVVVALWGDYFKSKLFPPKLELKVLNATRGQRTKETLRIRALPQFAGQPVTREEDAVYFYLTVSNPQRWNAASEVQVYLLQIEEPGPDGELIPKWSSELPLQWHLHEINPLPRRVGKSADAVLLSVVKEKWLRLHPLVIPNNLTVMYREQCHIVATFQAKSHEADSNTVRVQIDWNGGWHDGDEEMQAHLRIKEVSTVRQ